VLLNRQHEPLPLGMQYRLLDKDRLQRRIDDFDVNRDYNVILLVLANSPCEELRVKQMLLFAQQQPLPSRQAALHNVVRNLKVKYCYNQSINQSIYVMSWGATGTQQTRNSVQ